jgi:hypothetical protein
MALLTLRDSADPALPPGFSAHSLPEGGDAFDEARRIAGARGAGTLVWVRRADMAEFAVVLEPETPLHEARKSFFLGMNALLQAVAAHCPPDLPVSFDWPDGLRFNAGLVGGGRLGWPAGCAADDVPDWLVFGAMVRLSLPASLEPGAAPDAAALMDEGFEGAGPAPLIESFARFLMLEVDLWQRAGYGPALAAYLRHLGGIASGETPALTEAGDLRVAAAAGGAGRLLPLLPALERTGWLDRDRGAPRL